MKKLYFITGNEGKFIEVKSIIPNTEKINLDLAEIQEIDAEKIIKKKLEDAIKFQTGEFFCEDTSLYINCLNGLPGPLIKWFLDKLQLKEISNLVEKYQDNTATAKTIIGYTDGEKTIFFEGRIEGRIVAPNGENGFGWDKIFMPNGTNKTFAEMTIEEKNNFSMRKIALIKLKDYLEGVIK